MASRCRSAASTSALRTYSSTNANSNFFWGGDEFAQAFESFAGKIGLLERYARDVATRSRQSDDKAGADRVSPREDNRDHRCRHPCRENTCASLGNNDVDLLPDELGDDRGCAFAASLPPSNLDRDGAALDPADRAQLLYESGELLVRNRDRRRVQEPDGLRPRRLPRARRERPSGGRTAEKRDEFAPFHSIPQPSRQPFGWDDTRAPCLPECSRSMRFKTQRSPALAGLSSGG